MFYRNITVEQLNNLTDVLSPTNLRNLENLCKAHFNATLTNQQKLFDFSILFANAELTNVDAML